MTTRARDTAHGTTPQDVLLLHPDTLDAHPCRVGVSRRGLLLRRLPDRPSRTARRGALLRVPWWSVQGFSADEAEATPDGGTAQVVEVVTDAGTLSLLVPAPEVSVLLARVGRWSGRWGRSRRAPVAAVARRAALAAGALRPVTAPCRSVAARGAAAVATVLLWWAVAARALGRAAWRPLAAAARPVLGPLARSTAPARHRVARSAAGLAAASAWRRGRTASARLLGTDRPGARVRPVLAAVLSLALLAGAGYAVTGGGTPEAGLPRAGASPAAGGGMVGSWGMARMFREQQRRQSQQPIHLPKATAPPAPAPPSLADAPPLSPHEVFGFAPYWTLTQSTGFDVAGLTTIAYFSIGVNPDGSLAESGSGWDGYQSQDLANLVTRAHAAGVRVVLTVNCFDQGALDQLTSSPTAPTTLSSALVQAVSAKNLDGVNLDFEGEGSADQAGLTNLVAKVSTALHAANPHYQVTMDTYASSAGDAAGFYDIPALAPWVDGFFVMAYQLNLEGSPTPSSPLTSAMFSDLTTAQQYAAAVPPSKVIMGLPYYGYSWPTDNGTMGAQATGGATPVTYAQVMAGGYPSYWDPVTDTAWTSYQVGNQWYEDYYEDPGSLYMATQLSQTFGLGGVGIWALGMDGNDAQMTAALDGNAPAAKAGPAGPASTSASGTGSGATAGAPPAGAAGTGAAATGSGTGSAAGPGSGTAGTTTTTAPVQPGATTTTAPVQPGATTTTAPPTTTTTSPPSGGTTGSGGTGGTGGTVGVAAGTSFTYTGTWQGQTVSLTLLRTKKPATPVTSPVGTLTGFHTTNPTPALACLDTPTPAAAGLPVYKVGTVEEVVASKPADCTTAVLTFPVASTTSHVATATGTGTPATAPTPTPTPAPTGPASTTTTAAPTTTTTTGAAPSYGPSAAPPPSGAAPAAGGSSAGGATPTGSPPTTVPAGATG